MKNMIRLLSLVLVAGMLVGTLVITVGAEEPTMNVLVDECFDDYDDKYDAKSTTLFPTFVIDANSIGEGYVQVQENPDNGNLHLKSHVFTQVYTAEPIKGAYTFSMDVFQTQGNRNCAIFLRAPMCGENAFYEKDGSEDGNAACRTGIVVYCHGASIDVNIKAYSIKASDTSFLTQNAFTFDLPEGVILGKGEYTNFKVVDTGTEMSIFVADTLICRIVLSEPSNGYPRAEITEKCFRKAVLLDANGTEVATIDNPIVQCEGSTVGWATRVADMIVDNVYLATSEAPATTPEETNPAESTPAESTPAESTPAESTPIETIPAETAPEETTPAETAGETMADTTPVETTAETEAPAGGCTGSIAAGALVLMMGAAFVALKKKQ